jgi:hypothetical protein
MQIGQENRAPKCSLIKQSGHLNASSSVDPIQIPLHYFNYFYLE